MSQPLYQTFTSTQSGPWKLTNWAANPFNMSFAIISSGGSSGTIDATLEDPTRQYPNLASTTPTVFTVLQATGQATYLTGLTSTPIVAYRFTLNAQSSAGAPVTLVSFQAGIG
jgi:hypothetical protein